MECEVAYEVVCDVLEVLHNVATSMPEARGSSSTTSTRERR